MVREATDICLRVLKESSKSRFDSFSVRKSALIISHITFRDCRVHSFSDNLARNSCIRLKIYRLPNFNMLLQLVLTKFVTSELFSCLLKVDHVINQCKRPIYGIQLKVRNSSNHFNQKSRQSETYWWQYSNLSWEQSLPVFVIHCPLSQEILWTRFLQEVFLWEI